MSSCKQCIRSADYTFSAPIKKIKSYMLSRSKVCIKSYIYLLLHFIAIYHYYLFEHVRSTYLSIWENLNSKKWYLNFRLGSCNKLPKCSKRCSFQDESTSKSINKQQIYKKNYSLILWQTAKKNKFIMPSCFTIIMHIVLMRTYLFRY